MYLFEAHYLNMKIDNDALDDVLTLPIRIEEQSSDCEKEIYLYAMSQAYDKMPNGYCFDNLEFIAC